MNCTCYVVTSPSILCALWKPDLMTRCWTVNSLSPVLSCKVRQEQTWWWSIVVIRDDLSHNVTLMILTTWNCHQQQPLLSLYPVQSNFITHLVFQQLFILCRKITIFLHEFLLIGDFNVDILDISSTPYQFLRDVLQRHAIPICDFIYHKSRNSPNLLI